MSLNDPKDMVGRPSTLSPGGQKRHPFIINAFWFLIPDSVYLIFKGSLCCSGFCAFSSCQH